MANPILALIISFFLPGIGTVYAGNIMKGIIIFIVAVILGALATIFLLGIIAYILYVIVWLYGMYDESPSEVNGIYSNIGFTHPSLSLENFVITYKVIPKSY